MRPWQRLRHSFLPSNLRQRNLLWHREHVADTMPTWISLQRGVVRANAVHARVLVSCWECGSGCLLTGKLLRQYFCKTPMHTGNVLFTRLHRTAGMRQRVVLCDTFVASQLLFGLLLCCWSDLSAIMSRWQFLLSRLHSPNSVLAIHVLPGGFAK